MAMMDFLKRLKPPTAIPSANPAAASAAALLKTPNLFRPKAGLMPNPAHAARAEMRTRLAKFGKYSAMRAELEKLSMDPVTGTAAWVGKEVAERAVSRPIWSHLIKRYPKIKAMFDVARNLGMRDGFHMEKPPGKRSKLLAEFAPLGVGHHLRKAYTEGHALGVKLRKTPNVP